MPSVLIIDENNTFADAMRFAIDRDPGLRCVSIVPSLSEALDAISREPADHALVDVDAAGSDGMETARELRRAVPGIRMTVLSARTDPEVVAAADEAGVNHFIPKQSSMGDVLEALRSPHTGPMTLPGTVVVDLLRQRARTVEGSSPDRLTARELDILRGMAAGEPPKRIAAHMGVSVHTVRGHVKSIYWKLDAHNQLEAVAIARRRGLVERSA